MYTVMIHYHELKILSDIDVSKKTEKMPEMTNVLDFRRHPTLLKTSKRSLQRYSSEEGRFFKTKSHYAVRCASLCVGDNMSICENSRGENSLGGWNPGSQLVEKLVEPVDKKSLLHGNQAQKALDKSIDVKTITSYDTHV
ncbi:hypothetical protein TNCV_2191221 [Trichonephila clavipes]|nr:hypothetical protein TNCV_2191221 [Trichonephila clavipes]